MRSHVFFIRGLEFLECLEFCTKIRRSEFEPECLERDDHQLLKFSKFRGQSSEIRFKVNFYRINKYDLSFKIDFPEKVEIHAKSSGFFFTSGHSGLPRPECATPYFCTEFGAPNAFGAPNEKYM